MADAEHRQTQLTQRLDGAEDFDAIALHLPFSAVRLWMFLLSLKVVSLSNSAGPVWKGSTARKNHFLLEEREGELRKRLEEEQATIQLKRRAVD